MKTTVKCYRRALVATYAEDLNLSAKDAKRGLTTFDNYASMHGDDVKKLDLAMNASIRSAYQCGRDKLTSVIKIVRNKLLFIFEQI